MGDLETTPSSSAGALAGGLPVGTRLGRYELLGLLSVGGMAEIYLARTEGIANFEKLVVVKRMLPHFALQADYVEMFLAEARLGARLDHPNVVPVHDIGEETGNYYYAMEYVRGTDLRNLMAHQVRRGPMPIDLVIAIGLGMCAGLEHAHELGDADGRPLGVVHRDVSLSNVLLSFDGAVKVTDFGVAKQAASDQRTRTGTLKGKIGYMSPEHCRGQALDRRSDVFAIGIILYELVTGRRLFRPEEGDFAVLEKIVHHDVEPPSRHRSDLPPALESVILRALRRDRELRYQRAGELQADLEELARAERLRVSANDVAQHVRALVPISGLGPRSTTAPPPVDRGSASSVPRAAALAGGRRSTSIPAASSGLGVGRPPTSTAPPGTRGALEAPTDVYPVDYESLALGVPRGPRILRAMAIAAAALGVVLALAIGRSARAPAVDRAASAAAPAPAPAPLADPVSVPGAGAVVVSRSEPEPRTKPEPEPERSDDAPTHDEARPPRRDRAPVRPAKRAEAARPAKEAAVDAGEVEEVRAEIDAGHVAEAPAEREIAPPPPPVTAPPPTPIRPAVPRGSLDARPTLAGIDVSGPLQDSEIRRGLDRATDGFRACYRTAARAAGRTPATAVRVAFVIDESRAARDVSAAGGALPGLARCVAAAAGRIRTRIAPDVGHARVTIDLAFAPIEP